MHTVNSLVEKIQNAKALDFGTILSESIELFKKVWLQGLLVLILNAVLMFPLVFIMYIPMIFLGITNPDFFDQNQGISELDSLGIFVIIISIVLALVFFVMATALKVALKAAYFRIVKNKDLKLNVAEDYFFFLKRKYLKKTIILSLIMIGISIIAMLLFIIPFFYVLIPLSYMVVVYSMNPELSEREIVKVGFALGNKKWLFTLLLVIVSWFLSFVIGFFLCLVGIYVTQQFIDLPFYQVYRKSVGIETSNPIEEIGTLPK